ncbi:glycine--tRNA ligase beta subunit [Polymorphobacter glacialis]|uniref:Glycine--tRNA ligase beta subunit n=1 Tax=Sandarakinorhabdus glacialis TaxID=1614636 RepID=A0A916ZK55_9SPHN|nr:glycine--tRNA ligase subunit beta [Polymorphobacter glacialis]GGE01979.1 glycine--tRNA ligase beta subunit [Polymorphobacter glacialis]
MSAFLLELASEEIPARMQAAAAEQLRTRFVDGLKAAGLAHGAVVADATPRRLWLIAEDVAEASAASSEERKGPSASAPEGAIAGFLRGVGLTRDQLEERVTPKGVVLFAHIASPGRSAAAILAELVPAIVRDFQWPKSMRWGAGTVRWVRPLTGIVALLDGDVVACEAHGVVAGRETRGHRIMGGAVSVESAGTYAAQLLAEKVVVSSAERRGLIEAGATEAAAAEGLSVVPDAGLVAENAGLTEWPVPMLGAFDPAFLAVPREVIQLTMRTNQKYFACVDAGGELAPAFVCTANLVASDGGGAIIAGNERVLSARLADAKFFWDQDVAAVLAGGLEVFAPKLSDIVFHEKLGTVADKVARVAKLARWLVESGAVSSADGKAPLSPLAEGGESPSPSRGEGSGLADLAERAALLCKVDLVSATVGEFPEVQGVAGAYLARVSGEDAAVADAIRDHYKPVGQGDDVPTAPLSVAVALADKLDTIAAFFLINEAPTGSKDPFAIRRAALGVIASIVRNGLRFRMETVLLQTVGDDLDSFVKVFDGRIEEKLGAFFADRLKVQQRELGMRNDLIDAVFALGGEDDLVRLLARVRALQAVLATKNGTNLLAGVKRAASILRIEEGKDRLVFDGATDVNLLSEDAERALSVALDGSVPEIAAAVEREDFAAAMAALAGLRPAVDAFFEGVIVNAPDPAVRLNRLGLLARLRGAANSVADFSKIEG